MAITVTVTDVTNGTPGAASDGLASGNPTARTVFMFVNYATAFSTASGSTGSRWLGLDRAAAPRGTRAVPRSNVTTIVMVMTRTTSLGYPQTSLGFSQRCVAVADPRRRRRRGKPGHG